MKKYGSSSYKLLKRALIKTLAPFDLTYETNCRGFEIGGTEPPGTMRRIIFKIEDELYRFVNGILDPYPYHGEFEDVIEYGNTVGELLELENVPAFVNKKVYPIIAMSAPFDFEVMPRIKLALKVTSYNDVYTRLSYSPVFELAGSARIVSLTERQTTENNATAVTSARVRRISGEWSDWDYYNLFEGQVAQAIQFRTNFVVTTLDGTDAASIDSLRIEYVDDTNKNAANVRTFYTKTEKYSADLKTCYLLIKHEPLKGRELKAWVNLNLETKRAENVILGQTAGVEQTIYLPDRYVAQDTLHLEVGGVPFFDYELDTGLSSLKMQAAAGLEIVASYEYYAAENWQAMTLDFTELDKTRFKYRTLGDSLREVSGRIEVEGGVEVFGYVLGVSC